MSRRTWERSSSRTSAALSIGSRDEIEGPHERLREQPPQRRRPIALRQCGKVASFDSHPRRRADNLMGLAVLRGECRSQGLVPSDDGVERPGQHGHVELSRKAKSEGQVVVGPAGLELIEEPEPLLREGEGRRTGLRALPDRGDWARGRAFSKEACFEQGSLLRRETRDALGEIRHLGFT